MKSSVPGGSWTGQLVVIILQVLRRDSRFCHNGEPHPVTDHNNNDNNIYFLYIANFTLESNVQIHFTGKTRELNTSCSSLVLYRSSNINWSRLV